MCQVGETIWKVYLAQVPSMPFEPVPPSSRCAQVDKIKSYRVIPLDHLHPDKLHWGTVKDLKSPVTNVWRWALRWSCVSVRACTISLCAYTGLCACMCAYVCVCVRAVTFIARVWRIFRSRRQASGAGWIWGAVKKKGRHHGGQENRDKPHEAGFRSVHFQFNQFYKPTFQENNHLILAYSLYRQHRSIFLKFFSDKLSVFSPDMSLERVWNIYIDYKNLI